MICFVSFCLDVVEGCGRTMQAGGGSVWDACAREAAVQEEGRQESASNSSGCGGSGVGVVVVVVAGDGNR